LQILGSRRGVYITVGVGVIAATAAGTFAVSQVFGRPAVDAPSPAPGSATNQPQPVVSFDPGSGDVTDLRVMLDGEDVTAEAMRGPDDQIMLVPKAPLGEGDHQVSVQLASNNLLEDTADRTWGFSVDTKPPPITIASPKQNAWVSNAAVKFTGTTEPGAQVLIGWEGGKKRVRSGAKGQWTAQPDLPEGLVQLAITATDRAGNSTSTSRRVQIDSEPPELGLTAPGAKSKLTDTDILEISGAVPNESPEHLTYGVTVNGKKWTEVAGIEASAEAADLELYGFDPEPTLNLDGRRFTLTTDPLPQGTNTVVVWTRDRAGNMGKVKREVFVDTSSEFGDNDMVRGALGSDVTQLQERLKEAGTYNGKTSEKFDKKTEGAVRSYQKRQRLPVNGVIDKATRTALVGKIIVDLGDRQLTLIRDNRPVKTYPVAIGTSAHPSPVGSFTITTKQVDPTWNPPDSPWAEGLGPIAPGAGNPLGTRWIGTSASAIGIHGTYDDGSIGSAASHGCIRMHIPDVEELYESVAIGMDVSFQN
jgi:lipoprotein-anchoring transpeptidase ErfK/SrfK